MGAVGRRVKPKALGVASVVDDPEFLGGVGGLVIFQRHAGRDVGILFAVDEEDRPVVFLELVGRGDVT